MKRPIRYGLSLVLLLLLLATFGRATIAVAAELVQTDELTAEEHIERGKDFVEQGELELARDEFQAALLVEPDNVDARTKLGLVYIDLGQYDLAIAEFENVLASDPTRLEASGGLCLALSFTVPPQGEVQCLAVIKLDPENADLHNGLGIAQMQLQKLEEAIASFQKAIQLAPEHKWAHNNLGRTYLNMDNFDEAIAELNKAIEIYPENDLAYYNLGLAYALQQDYEQAIPYYELAVSHNPNLASAYSDMGLIYRDLGQIDQAIAALQHYLQLRPEDPNRAEIEAILVELGATPPPEVFVNAKIAFVSARDGNMEIYSMNTNGSQITRLTDDPSYDVEPAWSPDGERILFASNRGGNFDIYSMRADGSDVVQLTDDPANDFAPAWSPDGALVAFMTERDGNPSVYLMNADGSQQSVLISDPNSYVSAPTFSGAADVLDVAFITNTQGAFDLYVLDGASSEFRKLTQELGDVLAPNWSPNGRFIIFAANPSESYDLFLVRPDGTDLSQLTDSDVGEYKPRWSPDSNYIIYSVGLEHESEIAMLNESGEVVFLTNNTVFDGMPTWGPLE